MAAITNLPELLTMRQVCRVLSVHPNTLRNWDRHKKLKAIRVGFRGDRRWRKDQILRILKGGGTWASA
jgi:excisionase family DNA binding protein